MILYADSLFVNAFISIHSHTQSQLKLLMSGQKCLYHDGRLCAKNMQETATYATFSPVSLAGEQLKILGEGNETRQPRSSLQISQQ